MAVNGYLFDTSFASAATYKKHIFHKKARDFLDDLDKDDSLWISIVSLAEIEYGLNIKTLPSNAVRNIRKLLAEYTPLATDRQTAIVYGKIRADLFDRFAPRKTRNKIATKYVEDLRESTTGKALGIQENDLWIVSVAVRYNLVFVTVDSGGGMQNIVDVANYNHQTTFLK